MPPFGSPSLHANLVLLFPSLSELTLLAEWHHRQDRSFECGGGYKRKRRIPGRRRCRETEVATPMGYGRMRAYGTDRQQDERDRQQHEHEQPGATHPKCGNSHVRGEDRPRDQVHADCVSRVAADALGIEHVECPERDPEGTERAERHRSKSIARAKL